MTAWRALWRTASSARRAALLCAVRATTSYDLAARPMRSSVLIPTDPVAPSTVMRTRSERSSARAHVRSAVTPASAVFAVASATRAISLEFPAFQMNSAYLPSSWINL